MLFPWQHCRLQSLSVKKNISTCNLFKWDRGFSSAHKWFAYCLNYPHQIVVRGRSSITKKSGNFSCNIKQDQRHNCCHGNGMTGVILLLLGRTVLMLSLKNTTLIFLEIFLIECCTALLKPPMSQKHHLSHKNVNISKTKKDILKRKTPFFYTFMERPFK